MFSLYTRGVYMVGRCYTEETSERRKIFKSTDLKTWELLPLSPVLAYGVTVHAGNVIMSGGLMADTMAKNNLAWMCDPMSGAITMINLPYLPCKRSHHGMTTINNTWIVAVGGFGDGKGNMLNNFDCLKIGETSWTSLPPMPKPLYSPSCIYLNGCVYVMGGYANHSPLQLNRDVFCYSWETMQWRALAQTPVEYCTFAAVGGALMAIGNIKEEEGAKTVTGVWVFSEDSRDWVRIGTLPEYLSRCTSTSLSTGELLVIGSNTSTGGYSSVYKGRLVF